MTLSEISGTESGVYPDVCCVVSFHFTIRVISNSTWRSLKAL